MTYVAYIYVKLGENINAHMCICLYKKDYL